MVLSDTSSPDESISKAGEITPTTTTTSQSSRKSQQEIKVEIKQQLEQRFEQDRQQRTSHASRENLNLNVGGEKMAPKPHPRSRKDERDNHSYDGDDGPSGLGNCLANLLQWPVLIVAGIIVPVFAITFIIIGAVFINDCKIEPMIPVWLIVQGVIMLFGIGTGGFARRSAGNNCNKNTSLPIKLLGLIISILTAAWFIAGNVWVYQAWAQNPDYQHYWYVNGCDMSLFRVAFWGIIVLDVLFCVAAVVGVVAFLLRGCRTR